MVENRLIYKENSMLKFEKLTGESINQFSNEIIADTKLLRQKIKEAGSAKRTFNNTLMAWDNMYDRFNSGLSLIYLLAYVYPEDDVIAQAQKNISELNKLWNGILLDEDIYRALKEFETTDEAASIKPEFLRFLKKLIRSLEKNGLALPMESRQEIRELKDRILDLSLQFSTNIAAVSDELTVTGEEIEGLPDDYREKRKNADGTYKIDLSYPSFHPFMKYSVSEPARKKLYIKFRNRASDVNLPILLNLLKERKKLALKLGFKSFADLEIDEKMAKKPEVVWDFENSLAGKVKPKAIFDLNELLQVKKDLLDSENEGIINAWESAFYSNLILKNKYRVDQEKVKEYFELNNVINGLFTISKKLFGIEFKNNPQASVWHNDVKAFYVYQNGNKSGYFYLDLYPRVKKYNHAACFSLVNGKKHSAGLQMPVAALICNFPEPSKTKPSLLSHSEVETLFHEFGHLLHHLLSEAELSAQAGISAAHDFIEVPSQLFENWAWDYNALSLFARHYETGEILPQVMYTKMLAARNLGSGINALQQIFYGLLDMTLHNRFNPDDKVTTTEVVRQLQNSITPFPFLEGTYMEAGFDHLTGYAAGYYGYLWAKVYAEDIFSVFQQNGIFNRELGLKLKDSLLSQGSKIEEHDMLLTFLGREPDDGAFLQSLGI